MIPSRPASNCPSGTYNGLHTCFCEDHCSWETCRLQFPPHNCLLGIGKQATWAWDSIKSAWVAVGKVFKFAIVNTFKRKYWKIF